ncbi:MAG: hypothetical protein R3F49_08625 [Planctomycetota bacterium]
MSRTRPQSVAQEPRSAAAPALVLDTRRLRSLYLDLLGRPPFAAERDLWLGRGARELLDALLGSDAFWRHWFDEQLYYFMLIDNFRPEGEGVEAIAAGLSAGKLSVRDALHRIALLPSFDLRNPGADTFVTVVMEQLVGLTVQVARRELEIGKAAYDGRPGLFLGANASSQADVVRVAAQHKDSMRHFVAREYERVLGEPMERRALAAAARELHKDPRRYLDVLRGWLLSDGYAARLERGKELSNRLFVRALFVDLLGREPSDDEAETLRGALDGLGDSRPLRAVVVRMLLDSGRVPLPEKGAIADPTQWIAGEFRRLLGREAGPDELKEFVTVFHEPDCVPALIVQVLLADPAYHRY